MKSSDRTILTYLRKCNCQHFNDSEWAMVEDAVEKAGDIRNVTGTAQTIIFDAIKKATFSSRSEAGRYAANMRWKGQGERTAGAKGGKGFDSPKMKEQLAYEAKRDAALGGSAADIADRVGELDEQSEPSQADIAGMTQGQYQQDELRVFIDEQEGLLEVMEMNGESKDKISQQKRIIGDAKRDLKSGKSGKSGDSPEAKAKQAFIDAQKERLANMGRGTSQFASMALAAGIKQLESELASGDTSEARGKPGQFFDDYAGSKGSKYIGRRPNKVVAQDIRADLKAAQASGELPADLKFSVKMGSGGGSIKVRVAGVKNIRVRDDLGRDVTTPEAKAIYDKVDRITNAYNRDNSDIMTDYFDTDYYGFVNLEE